MDFQTDIVIWPPVAVSILWNVLTTTNASAGGVGTDIARRHKADDQEQDNRAESGLIHCGLVYRRTG